MERKKPKPQEFYRHFKNKLYQVVTVAKHSETGEELVVYQALYGDFEIYARPLSMFLSEVDHKKYPDVKQKYRFEKVEFEKSLDTKKDAKQKKDSKPEKASHSEKTGTDSERKVSKPAKDAHSARTETDSERKVSQPVTAADSEELPNPDLIEFLDAKTMEQKKRVLTGMRNRITDRLIDDIAASLDVAIEKGELSERYKSLMVCVDTLARFEVNRLR